MIVDDAPEVRRIEGKDEVLHELYLFGPIKMTTYESVPSDESPVSTEN